MVRFIHTFFSLDSLRYSRRSSFQKIARWHLKVGTFWNLLWLSRKFDQYRKLFNTNTKLLLKLNLVLNCCRQSCLTWFAATWISFRLQRNSRNLATPKNTYQKLFYQEQNNWEWRHKNLHWGLELTFCCANAYRLLYLSTRKPKQAAALMGPRVHNCDLWYLVSGMK